MDRHLGGIGTGDQVGGAEEVEKCFAAHPSTSRDDFFFHHGDVDRRAAHGSEAELEEEKS
jgi:hypothetical protein